MTWVTFHPNFLHARQAQILPGTVFKRQFLAALRGEENQLSRYIEVRRGRPQDAAWPLIRAQVFARDDYTCQYCGVRAGRLECDHVIPVSRGGTSNENNLLTACISCNRSKGNKLVSEWRK